MTDLQKIYHEWLRTAANAAEVPLRDAFYAGYQAAKEAAPTQEPDHIPDAGKMVVPTQEPAYTTGHCKNHKHPKGCQLHNLQCGWPECDRKPVTKVAPTQEPDINAETVLRLIKTIKYMTGIAERGRGYSCPDDVLPEKFLLEYVIELEGKAAPTQEPFCFVRYYESTGAVEVRDPADPRNKDLIPLYRAPPDAAAQIAELENLLKGVEAGFECAKAETERLRQELAGFPNAHDMRKCMIETADQNNRLMKHVSNLATELEKYRNAIGIVADVCESAMKGIEE